MSLQTLRKLRGRQAEWNVTSRFQYTAVGTEQITAALILWRLRSGESQVSKRWRQVHRPFVVLKTFQAISKYGLKCRMIERRHKARSWLFVWQLDPELDRIDYSSWNQPVNESATLWEQLIPPLDCAISGQRKKDDQGVWEDNSRRKWRIWPCNDGEKFQRSRKRDEG